MPVAPVEASPEVRRGATLELVRGQVKSLLTQSRAFQALPEDRRRDIAHDMVKVANYIVDANGQTQDAPVAATLAGTDAGSDFAEQGAVAARTGGDALTDTIRKVDFPQFVAGLVDGVFNAIVDSSIRQMEAYAELLKNVAKSVDEYMRDNITENQARDYLAEKYPEHLEVAVEPTEVETAHGTTTEQRPKLIPRASSEGGPLPDFMADLGLPMPVDSIDDESIEEQLVPAARRRMAMDRQQLLATMVLMGINRLVVTDGQIKASVLFELDTTDSVTKSFERETEYDRTTKSRSRGGFWGWFRPTRSRSTTNFKVSTTHEEDSEAKVEMHAKLTGDVKLNFKSETFPLERMTEVLNLDREQIEPTNRPQPNASANQEQVAIPSAPVLPPTGGLPG